MKEALKLALEFLERYQVKRQDFDTFEEAITAIKAALAQPAQEPVAWLETLKGLASSCPELHKRIYHAHEVDKLEDWAANVLTCIDGITTPQQRPWVGLTEAQFLEAVRLAENGNYLVAFVRIQEWLKEKNT